MVLPEGSEFGSRGSDSSGPLEILYDSRASSPSLGWPVMNAAWLVKRRAPSATSSGPTVHKTTMLVFPRSDIGILSRPSTGQRGTEERRRHQSSGCTGPVVTRGHPWTINGRARRTNEFPCAAPWWVDVHAWIIRRFGLSMTAPETWA